MVPLRWHSAKNYRPIKSLKAAMSNTSMNSLSVGEDGLNQVYNALNKMREIAVAANNGTASSVIVLHMLLNLMLLEMKLAVFITIHLSME